MTLTETVKATIKDAAQKLTGHRKRAFMAKVTEDYFDGSARKAETYLGWSRKTVQLGLNEQRSGLTCVDNYQARGRSLSETNLPNLVTDIHDLVDGQAQADPKFQTTFCYMRVSARSVREALIEVKGYSQEELPNRQTIGNVLNRMGYRLKKTLKVKPQKKIPETDAIFEHVASANQAADDNPKILRISLDSKAKVKIGNLSRGGKDRRIEGKQADDHDQNWSAVLVPFGILNLLTDQLSIYFGQSAETSDFVVDCLEAWWAEHHSLYPQIEGLGIDLDGGMAVRSNRTQFIKRMVQFAQASGLSIQLIYYPPYHSKYNPIERCWAALENYWNGAILQSVEEALQWASNMTWKGIKPLIHLVEGTYEKNITVQRDELADYKQQWHCSESLPKWDIKIIPS